MKKAAFFDRDGTINVNTGHLHDPKQLSFIEGVPQLIRRFNEAGYLVIVITNQAGIAKGFYTEDDMHHLHKVLNERLQREYNAHIDAFYFCPHHPDFTGPCQCRKPATGMLKRAIEDFDIDVTQSFLFGDMPHDIECGERMKIRSYEIQEALHSELSI
ncbi:HAD family hydrolase [Pygmaiobacter massiliensis]|uniref:D-glycero-alpha-D-manno-heptose-1,7-bisphosphate 7-phosphatase n=1 Tax=Pygmaiobacter massiliensis TaxID=1917873 RepID=UPI002A8261DC|nr:HAD family hydrolase [Pygmaiobacter massiliensis]MDY4784946.1 HAD family hydrolase [Pygmaiobacter massiliensis]